MELGKLIAKRARKEIYRSGDYCVKLFEEGYSKSDILNEALNQARVEETGLNIPKVDGVEKIDGKWAIVTDYIEGKTLAKLMEENPKKLEEYMSKFVDIQLSVHEKKCPLLTKLKDKMNRKISASGLDATTRYELHMRIDGMPKHNKLCHGDFTPGNIIIGDDGKDYIIDWSHATQGNGAGDAARTYLRYCLAGNKEEGELYLKLFCKKSDTARQYVDKWLSIVAASQLVKGKPEESEFLHRWATIVDFE